ncbi:MAG: hypothetical protein U1D30_06815 [Planctomycetota bacterium]
MTTSPFSSAGSEERLRDVLLALYRHPMTSDQLLRLNPTYRHPFPVHEVTRTSPAGTGITRSANAHATFAAASADGFIEQAAIRRRGRTIDPTIC